MRPLPLLALFAAPLLAQTPSAPSLQNLVQNSPFGSAVPVGQAGAAAGPLEFRGTFVDRGERFFSILDTASRRAEWVGLKDSGQAFQVKSYDPDSETVTLDYQGRSLSLKLRTARVTAMAMPPPTAAGPQQGIAPGGPNAASVTPAPTTTEAQRLAQVAEEIRRRRALRQQAQQQQPAPQPSPQPNQPPR